MEPHPSRIADDVLVGAIRGHFTREREALRKRVQRTLLHARGLIVIGLMILVVFLTLAELTFRLPPSHWREILREGLFITGWVALWRPVDALLYRWWPFVERRRWIDEILRTEIAIEHTFEGRRDLRGSTSEGPSSDGGGGFAAIQSPRHVS